MMHSKKRGLFLLLALLFAGGLAAFPLWLDQPQRANPHDPKSVIQRKGRTTVKILFEDFEAGALLKSGTWGDAGNGSTESQGVSGTSPRSGNRCNALLVTSQGYGAGTNFQSNYFNAAGIIDAGGAIFLDYSIRADQAFSYTVRWKEGSENGGDKENWVSTTQNYTAVGSWQDLKLLLTDFSEETNNPDCSPNCLTQGNNRQDLQAVKQFEIQILPSVTAINIYLDDIYFEIPGVIPTPTLVPTPCGTCGSPSGTFGFNPVGFNPATASWNYFAGYIESARFHFSSGGEISDLSIYVGGASVGGTYFGNMQMAVYRDNGSAPSTLLASTAIFTPVGDQWNTQPLLAQVCLSPGYYYLAFTRQDSGSDDTFVAFTNDSSNPAAASTVPESPGTPPNPYPALWGHDLQRWAIYASYCP